MLTDMPKTDDVVAQILQKAIDAATSTGDFIAGQIPDLVKQLLLFSEVESGLLTLFGFSLILFSVFLVYKIWKLVKEDGDYFPLMLILTMISIIGCIVFFSNICDFIKIWLAPKLWLLEYTVHLVHK